MSKKVFLLLLVAIFILSACGVPKEDLEDANERILELSTVKATLEAEKSALEAKVADLQKKADQYEAMRDELKVAEETLDDWQSIKCDHTWDEVMNDAIMSFVFTQYSQVPEELQWYVSITGWSTDPNWQVDLNQPFSVLIFDREFEQNLVIDGVEDCIIMNPEAFPFSE